MRSQRSLRQDERGIEGLPIRLVIALVVGVAALSLMMGILGGFSFGGQAEVDVKPQSSIVDGPGSSGSTSVTVTVVTEDGEPVEGARVIAMSGTLNLDSPIANDGTTGSRTGGDGEATVDLQGLEWRSNQEQGTVTFDVRFPGDAGYVDNSPNTKVTVLRP